MELGLKGKSAIVTGGAKGIGAAISEGFAKEGARVAVCYRSDPERCEAFIQGLRDAYQAECIGVRGDLGCPETVREIYDRVQEAFGACADILVNNAGGAKTTALTDISLEEWNNTLQGNVTATMYMSREFARRAIQVGKGGKIVNILSKVAVSATSKNRACYVVNKTAELGLTRQLAVDLVEHGIIVNGVLPGLVITELNRDMPTLPAKEARMPKKRAILPGEIADTTVYLASNRAEAMVGSLVDCSGGLLLGF